MDRPSGTARSISQEGLFNDPIDIAIGPGGDLFVPDEKGGRTFPGAVLRIAPDSGAQMLVADGNAFLNPMGIAFEPGGELLKADSCELPPRPAAQPYLIEYLFQLLGAFGVP